ncbi:unnamed protein product [Calicophoron daubneyi]|uniref:Phorbol-ester/DAG-type domain-containing protein n=1 Tax=Calicophoron daubneyi TaxID=300641 RepID=A0AAV2TUX2_CALDB
MDSKTDNEPEVLPSNDSVTDEDDGLSGYSKSGQSLRDTFQGHSFVKKNLRKPATCHHCCDLLWGILGTTGMVCEVCNFLVHEKCMRLVVSACTCIAPFLIRDPVPHCWSEIGHFKRKFCNVCRKRLDDLLALRCEICEYYSHYECLDFAAADCKQCAISTMTSPEKSVVFRTPLNQRNTSSSLVSPILRGLPTEESGESSAEPGGSRPVTIGGTGLSSSPLLSMPSPAHLAAVSATSILMSSLAGVPNESGDVQTSKTSSPTSPTVSHYAHHWREGNLPVNSKCAVCRKTCWSTECLIGIRCEWCGLTVSNNH